MAYDFYNPVLSARLVTNKGEIIPLWMGLDSPSKGPVLAALDSAGVRSLPFVSEIRVEVSLGYLSNITVTLTPPYEAARAILDADPSIAEWGQSRLEIQFGYGGDPSVLSPVFKGLTLKPEVSLGSEITITLRAQGPAAFSASRQESNLTGTKTRRAWIKTLAAGSHLGDTRSVEVDFSDADKDPKAKALLDAEVEISQSFHSDYWMVWKLVKESKCWLVEEGGTWRVISRRSARLGKPQIRLAFRDFPQGKLGPDIGIYPILSVSSPSMAMFIPGAMRGAVLRGLSSKDKQLVEKSVAPVSSSPLTQNHTTVSVEATAQGKQAPPENENFPGGKSGSGGTFHFGDPTMDKVVSQAKTELEVATSLMGIPLNVETVGVPEIHPGQIVQVTGVGKRFDGNYYITKMEHVVGTDGFSSSLEMISNAAKIDDGFDPSGAVNTKSHDPGERGTVTVEAKKA